MVPIILMAMMLSVAQSAFGQQPAQPPTPLPIVEFNVEVLGSTLSDFTATMDTYAALRQSLQEGLPTLTLTDNPGEIRDTERLLAARIRRARAGAGRGQIFTEEIRRGFKQLLRKAANQGLCEAVYDDNPGEFQYPINGEYPKNKPLSTVPPSILKVLPRLPEEVWYRFLGRDLILHDSRANVILDRIDDAIRCADDRR